MEAAQEKLRHVSRAMTVIFRIAAAAAGMGAAFRMGEIGVPVVGGEERKQSILASYDVTRITVQCRTSRPGSWD